MSSQEIYALLCTVCAVVQAVGAGVFIYDYAQRESRAVMSSRGKALALALTLPALCLALGLVSHWLWTHHESPTVVEKIVTVDKPIPCPPAQTGDVTSRGGNSPAISGSNNSIDYGQTPPVKKQ